MPSPAKPIAASTSCSLWVTALERGYEAGLCATYKQWAANGAQVRKGEKAAPIVFYQAEIARRGRRRPTRARPRPCAWRAAIGCSPPSRWTATAPQRAAAQPDRAHRRRRGLRRRDRRPCRRRRHAAPATGPRPIPSTCRTRRASSTPMAARAPRRSYGVLGHEVVHWGGAAHRLNRTFGKRFGDDAYCHGGICAEIGARLPVRPPRHRPRAAPRPRPLHPPLAAKS